MGVAQGELMTVLGPSGSGKTTLLRAIAGFETPDAGTISVSGQPVRADGHRTIPAHERGIGLVPQEGALFPHLSVAQNVAFGLRHLGRRDRHHRVDQTLELVGLGALGKRRPHELSGGQQQRVALARAIAPGPGIILLDEPFSALDAYLRETLRGEVRQLLRELGTTAILVTHDQEEALSLGDRVTIMREGKVIQVADPREAYYRPSDLELAQFLGEAVIVAGEVEQVSPDTCRVACPFGDLPVGGWHGSPGACNVMIRPENIRIHDAGADLALGGVSGAGLCGTILDHKFYGHDGLLRVQVPELAEHVLVRIVGDQIWKIGDDVQLTVDRAVSTYA